MIDERDTVFALRHSAFFTAIERAIDRVEVAWAESGVAQALERVAAGITPLSRHQVWWGVATVSAALVHVGLQYTGGAPPGWMWLLLPVVTGLAGALLIVTGRATRLSRTSSDS
jgi:hypothetical protein